MERGIGRLRMKRPDLAVLKALKELLPCVDCRRFYPYWCMDFDHVGKKGFALRTLVARARVPWLTLLRELAHCEVICANCHRFRTFRRRFERGDQRVVEAWKELGLAPVGVGRAIG